MQAKTLQEQNARTRFDQAFLEFRAAAEEFKANPTFENRCAMNAARDAHKREADNLTRIMPLRSLLSFYETRNIMAAEERSFFPATEVRAVETNDGTMRIQGIAASYNTYSSPIGGPTGFKEKIRPGAFDRAIREKQDVRCLFQHDPKLILGRTSAATLTLRADSRGLSYSCILPNTSVGRDAYESIRRGDINGSSFAFNVKKPNGDVWGKDTDENGNTFTTRELTDLDIFDVSPVTYPQYTEGTSVQARAKQQIFLQHSGEIDLTPVADLAERAWQEFVAGEEAKRQRRLQILNSIL